MRSSVLALAALAVAGCGAIIDRSDFKPLTPADVAKVEAKPIPANTDDKAPSPAGDTSAPATPPPAPAAPAETPAAPAAEQPAPGLFARLFGADKAKDETTVAVPPAAADAAKGETAEPVKADGTATKPDAATIASASAEAEADLDNIPADEVSEADLAGEEEADPSKIAVPKPPVDDGREHDFVNVYTSKPERPSDLFENLPGVAWQGNLVITSIGPGGDPNGLFGGETQPFARFIPGMPPGVVQSMNGLLLAHSAINVSCVKPNLLGMIRDAERHFSHRAVITSGYRSPSHNRRVNGALHSQHLYCNAVDLFMPGVARDDLARYFYGHPSRGGLGLYCHTKSIHVDTGRRREWRWACKGRG